MPDYYSKLKYILTKEALGDIFLDLLDCVLVGKKPIYPVNILNMEKTKIYLENERDIFEEIEDLKKRVARLEGRNGVG